MSERLDDDVTNVESYQRFVSVVRNKNLGEDWRVKSAEYLSGEMVEALTQHGGLEAARLFLPSSFIPDYQPNDITPEVRYAIADELGDSLWFTVDCLDRVQGKVTTACEQALESFGVSVENPIHTFSDLQQVVIKNADKIRYINKAGLMVGRDDIATAPDHFVTTLPQNPLLHLTRTNRRLARSLEEGKKDIAPYASGADLEPVSHVPLAAGQHLLTIAWLAQERLGVSMNGIASFNVEKLLHRQIHGKENDIHFNESYVNL